MGGGQGKTNTNPQPSSVSKANKSYQENISQRSSVQTFVKEQFIDSKVIEAILKTLNEKKYSILKSLGQGAFGIVFKAVNKDNKEVAIKLINASSEESFESCKQEVELLKQVNSQHVIQLFDSFVDEENKIYYIITEYCPQNSLQTYLKKHPHPVEESILKIFQGIILGIIDLHKNKVIHSDLKPSNILLDENNEAKICDFGLSILKENNTESLKKQKGHTPNYCAQEQIMGTVGFSSDIYSAGIILRDLCYPKKMGLKFNPQDNFEDCNFPQFVELIKLMTHQIPSQRIKLIETMKILNPKYQVDNSIQEDIQPNESQSNPQPNPLPINKIDSIYQDLLNEFDKLTNEGLLFQSEFFKKWEEDIKKNKSQSFLK